MNINSVKVLFDRCNAVLSYRFNLLGISINLWAFILFDVVLFNVVHWILELFKKD